MLRLAPAMLGSVLVYGLPSAGTFTPTTKPTSPTTKTADEPLPMPDVVIEDVSVDANCLVVVRFANRGTAPIPADVTKLTMKLSGIANVSDLAFSADRLRAPGATFTYTASGTGKATATAANQEVSILATNPIMAEPNKANNYSTKSLVCSVVPPGPDLALTVTTNADCTKTIDIANIGDGTPDVSLWRAIPIKRTVDGMTLFDVRVSVLDPQQLLAKPGGKVTWKEPAEYRAYDNFEYRIAYGPYERGDNKANNVVQAAVPAACKGTRPPVDVAVTSVSLDSSCRVIARLKNVGTNPLPPFDNFTMKFTRSDKPPANFLVSSYGIVAPGAETTASGPAMTETTAITVKATFVAGALPQTRTDNDEASASLRCFTAPTKSGLLPRMERK